MARLITVHVAHTVAYWQIGSPPYSSYSVPHYEILGLLNNSISYIHYEQDESPLHSSQICLYYDQIDSPLHISHISYIMSEQ